MNQLAEPCEIIPVPDALRRKALVFDCTLEEGMRRAVRRAEAAVGRVTRDLDALMDAEVDRLVAAHQALAAGYPGAREVLFRAAHDLRGLGPSLGFPLAGQLGRGLARLLAAHPAPPPALIANHLSALRAMVRERVRASDDPMGNALVAELDRLVEESLARSAHLPA